MVTHSLRMRSIKLLPCILCTNVKMADEVDRLKVTELREELKKRGISYVGNKAALVQRLKNAIASNEKADQEETEEKEGKFDSGSLFFITMKHYTHGHEPSKYTILPWRKANLIELM